MFILDFATWKEKIKLLCELCFIVRYVKPFGPFIGKIGLDSYG